MPYSITEFESLYVRCFTPSFRVAMSLLHDEEEARDAVHEVFLKLWESKMEVAHPQAFVVRAVRNACLNRINALDLREKMRQRLTLEPPPEDFDYEAHEEEVRAAVSQLLTNREKEVVQKVFTEGLTYKEAGGRLGISVAAVNKNVVAALRKLRLHFKTSKS